MRIPQQPTESTLLSSIVDPTPKPVQSPRRLFATALLYTLVSVILCHAVGFAQAGVLSIFLAASSLTSPFNKVLNENRDAIWERQESPRRANGRTAVSVLALFTGILAAFVLTTLYLGEERARTTFSFALEAAHLSGDTLLTRHFGNLQSLFFHNAIVLGFVVLLSLIYRSYGALVSLCWIAALWGVVLSVLVMRGAGDLEVRRMFWVLVAAIAILPHLLLEAMAYVLASLGAIFLSKGATKYGVDDVRLRRVAAASARLFAFSLVALILAAVLEEIVGARIVPAIPIERTSKVD